MKEFEICQKIINTLSGNIECDVIYAHDFSDKRGDSICVVGIENTKQMNVDLPDYDYTMTVMIDSFIVEDKTNEDFKDIVDDVENALSPYYFGESRLSELFDDIPVVGFFLIDKAYSVEDRSNRCVFTFRIVASF